MAQWLNPETGEMEEKPDEGPNAFSTQGATSVGPGLQGLYNQPQQQQSASSWNFDGGDWARQNEAGTAQFKNLDGTWSDVGRGAHSESQGYINTAVNDPNVDKLVAYQRANPNNLNNEQTAFFSDPIGMLDSYGQGSRWGLQDLFDNQFSPQQAGYLSQTGGNKYLSPSDVSSGNDFNFRESAGEQAKRANANGGLFGNDLLNWAGQLAASYFGGPIGAGVYSVANSGGDIGKGLAAAAMTYAGGEMGGVGSGAEGGSWYTPAGNLSNLFSDTSPLTVDPTTGSEPSISNPIASEVPTSVGNMEQGFRELSQNLSPSGWNQSALNPEGSSLSNTGTTSLSGDASAWNPGSGELPKYDGITNTTPYTPDYDTPADIQQAVDYGTNGADIPNGMDTSGSTNRFQSYANTIKNGGMSMKDMLTNPIGGKMNTNGILSKLFQAPSPLEIGVRGLGALDSWNQGKKAQALLADQYSKSGLSSDSNAQRGMTANNMWSQTQQDPMYGYDTFMQGAGHDFVNQARAAAAKNGSRGGYLNSGRMNTDLASLWQKNQTQRATSLAGGFASNPYAAQDSIIPAYASMVRNQNSPILQGAQGVLNGFKLADLFNGD